MAEYYIDALGDFCPVPILKVQAVIKQMQAGDQILLITDHSCTVTTLRDEIHRKRLKAKVEEVDNGIWQITIVKP